MQESEIGTGDDDTVLKEVEWGATYRHDQKQKRRPSIPPKLSPINLQRIWEHYQITKQLDDFQRMNWQIFAKPPPAGLKLRKRKADIPDRNALSRQQYINLLATPKRFIGVPPTKLEKQDQLRKLKKKLAAERCSPRLIQLAVPKKRLVLYTWRDFEHLIPSDFIPRLQDLLNVDRTLDLKFARCYFKNLDRKRKRLQAKKRRKRKKQMKKRQKDCDKFLRNQIKSLSKLIVEYIRQEPLMALNFKQSLISDVILNNLVKQNELKRKPARNSNNAYKQGVIDITDQIAVWIDTICRYVDVQYTESDEDLRDEFESELGEEEEEYEGEEEEGGGPIKRFSLPPLELPPLGPLPPFPAKIGLGEGEDDMFGPVSVMQALLGQVATGKAGAEGDLMIDEDTLELLISILSYSTPEMLSEEINPNVMPGITYNNILEKLKRLRDTELQAKKKQKQILLEEIMTSWAKANKPEEVDENIINKIQYAAGILAECLSKEGIQMMQKAQKEFAGVEGGEGIEGGEGETGEGKSEIPAEALQPISDADVSVLQTAEGEGDVSATEPDTVTSTVEDEVKEGGEDKDVTESEATEGGVGEGDLDDAEFAEGKIGGDEFIKGLTEGGAEEGDLSLPTSLIQGGKDEQEAGDSTEAGITEELAAMGEGEGPSVEGELPIDTTETGKEPSVTISVDKEAKRPSEISKEGASASYDKLRTPIPGVIPAHKPPQTFEHTPDTICCLTLKVWATWLLEVANNAHMWSKWINDIIQEVRRIASIIRGEVKDAAGNPIPFYKEDWIEFSEKVDHMIVSWRQYSMHVKDLTDKLIRNFKDKGVRCCPKCLEDNLIVNIAVAHDITEQLAEAMNTAAYWRRWLDTVVMETKRLTTSVVSAAEEAESQGSHYGTLDIVEIVQPQATDSEESLYEIEEIDEF